MELSSSINNTWKLCIFGSLISCLFLLIFLNHTYQNDTFSAAKNTMLKFTPYYEPQAPTSIIITKPKHLQPSFSANSIPPSYFSEIAKPSNLSSFSNETQPNSTLVNNTTTSTTNFSIPLNKLENSTSIVTQKTCNMFVGKWVYKAEEVPTYDANKCPFIEEKISCQKNGRPDFEYEKWRWEAKDCDIPLFNAIDMLEKLRDKRVIIVGDSLNRNMWESLSCLLYSSVSSLRSEVHAESWEYKVLKVKDYNTIVEFYWSPFLIEYNEQHKSGKKVLVLDKVSPNSEKWRGADVMVFNSGHWWAHTGKFKRWDLYEYEGQLLEELPIEVAYHIAMKTWAKWVEENVDTKKTNVFFRSISAEHNGKPWCYNSTKPIIDESFRINFPKSLINIIETLINRMSKHSQVTYLNVTRLSEYRVDAHPSVYRSSWKWKIYTTKYKRLIPSYADCSHWCLPGLPDTWNRLLYASLFFNMSTSMSSL